MRTISPSPTRRLIVWSASSSSHWSPNRNASCPNARAVRPGGEIILVNHLYSERGVSAAVERWFAKPSRALGLRPEFPFARLATWARVHGGVELIERRPIKPFGVFTLVRFRRIDPETAAQAA